MKWGYAETSIIARAQQKDEYYIQHLDKLLREVINLRHIYRWLGVDTLPISATLYYLFTTLRGSKTLGEEYCQLLPVDSQERTIPSFTKRLLLSLSPLLGWLSDDLHALHRVLFYWEGRYLDIVRRLLSLRYVYHPRRPPTFNNNLLYPILAGLALPVVLVRIWRRWKDRPLVITEEPAPPQAQCSLCLGRRLDTAVTRCGHLFCWRCIYEWLRNRPECPLCRASCHPPQLYCIIDPY